MDGIDLDCASVLQYPEKFGSAPSIFIIFFYNLRIQYFFLFHSQIELEISCVQGKLNKKSSENNNY